MTFWPVAEAVKQAAAIVETDTSEQARSKIDMLLPPDSEESRLIAEHVAGVIGLGQSSGGIQQSFWALRRLFEALAQSRPLILVFDDVHWAEPTFVDFLDYLVQFSKGSPLFVLCMARPEFLDTRAPWMTPHDDAVTIRLLPLEEDKSQRLVQNLLGQVSLAEDVMDRILESAEGNPLFVEEMLRMMVDGGLLVKTGGRWVPTGDISSFSIPSTIHALLAARLDHLAPEEREALQCGSVVGQVRYDQKLWNPELEGARGVPSHLTKG
jgi:predicted ATPase